MKEFKLLCDTNTMCYGSSSALLAILSYIPGKKTALVYDITKEILEADSLIDDFIEINVKDSMAVFNSIDFDLFDAVLVVSNLTNLEIYLKSEIPVFFVDILYWYKTPKNHPIWENAIKCFVENFPGVSQMIPNNSKAPEVVGPLIRDKHYFNQFNQQNIKEKFDGILVNIGGGKSRWIKPRQNTCYPQLIMELINQSQQYLPDGDIILAGGKEMIQELEGINTSNRIKCLTLSQTDFLDCLATCKLFITSPGLNAVMEGLEFDKPMIFLPPQNASQILQLEKYELAGIVPKGMNLTDHTNIFQSLYSEVFNEQILTEEVLIALKFVNNSKKIKNNLVKSIEFQIKNLETASHKRSILAFKAFLWPTGAKRVAEYINLWWQYNGQ